MRAVGPGAGARGLRHHLGGPALLIRQTCTPALWLPRVVPMARQVPNLPVPQFPHLPKRKGRSSVGATTLPSAPGPELPRVGAAARTARVWRRGLGRPLCGQVRVSYLTLSSRCDSDRRQGNSASMAAAHSPQSPDSLLLPYAPPLPAPATLGMGMPHQRAVPVTRGGQLLRASDLGAL